MSNIFFKKCARNLVAFTMPTRSSSRVPSGTSNPRARRRLFLSSVDDGGGASLGSGAPLIAANSTTENQAVSHASDIV